MEIKPEEVEYALSVLYKSEQSNRIEANKWLTNAQRNIQAWDFVWKLLDISKCTEVQFFAATTLQIKLSKYWHEVPTEERENLYEKISTVIGQFAKNGPELVLNKLCVCLAIYLIQLEGANFLERLRPFSSLEYGMLAFQILKLIPEEFNNIVLEASKNEKTLGALNAALPTIINSIQQKLQTVYDEKVELSNQLIEEWGSCAACAESWTTFDFSGDIENRIPLAHALYSIVHRIYIECSRNNVPVEGKCLETCESCLLCLRALSGPEISRSNQVGFRMTEMLLNLAQTVVANENIPDSPNEELLSAIYSNANTLGEVQSRKVVESLESNEINSEKEVYRNLVRLLLKCQASPGDYPVQETKSLITFGFWFVLLMDSQDRSTKMSDELKGVYSQLLEILLDKLEPPKCALEPDQKEMLTRYRHEVGDVLMYCNSVLGDQCWRAIAERTTIGSIYGAISLADVAPHTRYVADILETLRRATQLSQSSDLETCILGFKCINAYADWLGSLRYEEVGEVSDCLLSSCIVAINSDLDSRIKKQASKTALKLCLHCEKSASNYVTPLVQLAISNPSSGALAAASAAISHTEPKICKDMLDHLLQAVRPKNYDTQTSSTADATKCKCGGCSGVLELLKYANSRDITCHVLKSLNQDFIHLAAVHSKACIPLLKQIVTILLEDCGPLLPDLCNLIRLAVETKCTPDGIELVRLMCLMFWKDNTPVIGELLSNCIVCALKESNSGSVDTADALLSLIASLIKKVKDALGYIQVHSDEIIHLACVCVSCNACVRSAASTLVGLASIGTPLQKHLETLLRHFYLALSGSLPKSQVEPLGEILLVMKEQGTETLIKEMLTNTLQPLGNVEHTTLFIESVFRGRKTKRKMIDAVREYLRHI